MFQIKVDMQLSCFYQATAGYAGRLSPRLAMPVGGVHCQSAVFHLPLEQLTRNDELEVPWMAVNLRFWALQLGAT